MPSMSILSIWVSARVTGIRKLMRFGSIPSTAPGNCSAAHLRQQNIVMQGYSNASLTGALTMQAWGTAAGNSPGVGAAGLATFDGAGNVISTDVEQNVGGTVTPYTGSGSYNVASNGRTTISAQGLPAIAYLVDSSQGLGPKMFAISGDATATLAYVQQQQQSAPSPMLRSPDIAPLVHCPSWNMAPPIRSSSLPPMEMATSPASPAAAAQRIAVGCEHHDYVLAELAG